MKRVGSLAAGVRADLVLVGVFVLACLWSANSFFNPNMVARVALSHSLAAQGATDIDEVAELTIDKAAYQGHYYCDKAPGMSLFCAPAVFVAERVADLLGKPDGIVRERRHTTFRYVLDCLACLLTTTTLASAAMLVAFRRVAVRLAVAPARAALMALALGFGTPIFTWSTTVFGHATAASLLFLLFALHWWPWKAGAGRWLTAGALVGAAVLVEFTAAIAGAILLAALVLADRPDAATALRRAALIAAAGLPFALALAAYNTAAFGAPLHLGYESTEGWEGMKTGFFGLTSPKPAALWGISFSEYRGLVWLSPATMLGWAGAVALAAARPTRALGVLLLAVAATYFLVNASYYYWDGGSSLGPRHLTPAVPFLFLALAVWQERLPPPARTAIAALVVLGVAVEVIGTCTRTLIPHDGTPMLRANVLPYLDGRESDLALHHLPLPFPLLVAVPLLLAGAGALLLWRETRRPTA